MQKQEQQSTSVEQIATTSTAPDLAHIQTLNPDEAARRVLDLRHQLEYHNYRYHVLDDPQVTDAEYDALFRELRALEDRFPELLSPDSPTQRVGASVAVTEFPKVRH